jgi:four helix bundle protein
MKILSHKDLLVWQHGVQLVKAAYQLTKQLPKEGLFGLCSQIRRAAVSIPANIAEGHGRRHTGEYIRYLTIANGSLQELETLIEISFELGYFNESDRVKIMKMIEDESRMISRLIQSLRA